MVTKTSALFDCKTTRKWFWVYSGTDSENSDHSLLIAGPESSLKMAYTRTSLLTLLPYSANMPSGSKGVLTKEHAIQQNLVCIHLPLLPAFQLAENIWKSLVQQTNHQGGSLRNNALFLALLYGLGKKRNIMEKWPCYTTA